MKTKTILGQISPRTILAVSCFLIIATYVLMIDLKGIDTDEGMRLSIMNGGEPYSLNKPQVTASWKQVLEANSDGAYQPLYSLIQNTLMRVGQSHDIVFLRLVNVAFLGISLLGLVSLSKSWCLLPRIFLIGLFSLNAYLFMHVLQVREYILGVAFYIWSTWLVFKLDRLELRNLLPDLCWFATYGILLIAGFYLQAWVVFPAIGQFLFLVVRHWHNKSRFYDHLAFSYLIVISGSLPYLLANTQKANVGLWSSTASELWPQLSTGFHLVLTGHLTNQTPFTDFLFWFWLTLITCTVLLFFRTKKTLITTEAQQEFIRQGAYMSLCIAASLAFQIGYFYKIEDLSLWPRYFIIHYFFLTWLIALAFKYICDIRQSNRATLWIQRGSTVTISLIMGVMMTSGLFQIRSYYQNPFLDTSSSKVSNWRVWTSEFSRIVRPNDLVISHDYISRATMTFTLPMINPVILLHELEKTPHLKSFDRAVYMESSYARSVRGNLLERMSKLGFLKLDEINMHTSDGHTIISEWKTLVFTRS